MLTKLSIKNYALIESLQMDFYQGLSTLTGETGAGKSVIIGALSLLTGHRADITKLRDKSRKAVIEAEFSTDDIAHLIPLFETFDMEWDQTMLVIRRELSPDGRSRIFVNDSPVSLKQLSALGPKIIDIHSQHSNLMLEDADFRLQIIDLLAENDKLLAEYRDCFRKYAELRGRLKRIKEDKQERAARLDYYVMQAERLHRLAPKRGELKALEREQELLSNAENLSIALLDADRCLWQGDISALSLLDQAKNSLTKIGASYLGPNAEAGEELLKRINATYLELKDIAETVGGYSSDIVSDPARLQKVQDRIELYYENIAAAKVENGDQLVDKLSELEQVIESVEDTEAQDKIERETSVAASNLKLTAAKLTESRAKEAAKFASELTLNAIPLGMKNLKFEVKVTPAKLSVNGGDAIEFRCSFNKNSELLPVQKIASGGEISRLMLALKSIVASKLKTPVLIFDEVDTGVSGEIADKMGKMMSNISQSSQVIAITHLPQVAALGARQYLVSKSDTEYTTLTAIKLLTDDEREIEIARMLSGESINDAAIENARALLNPTK